MSDKPNKLDLYEKLHDGLSDMIERGRLHECDIPDDYRWLVDSLAEIGGTPAKVWTVRDRDIDNGEHFVNVFRTEKGATDHVAWLRGNYIEMNEIGVDEEDDFFTDEKHALEIADVCSVYAEKMEVLDEA